MVVKARSFALGVCLSSVAFAACECDGIEGAAPRGYLDPAILDLGPVALGTECDATLQVVNNGTADLSVSEARLVDNGGDYSLLRVPQFVGFATSSDLLVRYVAEGEGRQSVTVEVATNIPENDGVISAVITALPTDEQAAVAVAACDQEGAEVSPCPALDFGATQRADASLPSDERPGRTLQVHVVNEGNAEMQVAAAVIDGGDGDFSVTGLRLGNILSQPPVRLAPGRDGNCGAVREGSCTTSETCNRLTLDVKYAPTALGGDTATLVILSDAAEGAELRVPLAGFGSDIGIVTTPEFVVFGDIVEGQSDDIAVRIANVGTNDAPVNNTCIDVGGDGTCDGECTGAAPALDGALSCIVDKADGGREGKGFVLAATDAQGGGEDERLITVTFAPVAGNANIPLGTTLRLETAILDNRVYEVPIAGGAAGLLEVDTAAACGETLCVQAEGDPGDISTWAGEIELDLVNAGDASLTVTAFEWEGAATIADDYDLLDADDQPLDLLNPGIALAPGARVRLKIAYANDDASVQDFVNLLVEHTGLGRLLTLPLRVLPPS